LGNKLPNIFGKQEDARQEMTFKKKKHVNSFITHL
jgi:hypothetical protein